MTSGIEKEKNAITCAELRAALGAVVLQGSNFKTNSALREEDDDYDEVYPGIWISSQHFAKSIPTLTKIGITHVLNCAEGKGRSIDRFICVSTGPQFYETTGIVYKGIQAVDNLLYNLSKDFDECGEFIADALKQNGKVLVHCLQGISRSATIVAAYLIKYNGLSAKEALVHIGSKRQQIYPNMNFVNLLLIYDAQLHINRDDAEIMTKRTGD